MSDADGSGARGKGKTVVKAIVFGNESTFFGKKREMDGHTHEWSVYVRPFDASEDMSAYVKRVTFKLHESYTDPLRVCNHPPFQVTETGWGEFEVVIKIYFVGDGTERPATLYHLLRLFANPLLSAATQPHTGSQGQLVSESYDEVIFQEPSLTLYKQLTCGRTTAQPRVAETDWKAKEVKTLASIQSAKKRVSDEISQMNERLKKQKNAIQTIKEEIQKVEKQQKAAAT